MARALLVLSLCCGLAVSARADSQPTFVTFKSDGRQLHGYLFRPDGAGPFPAVVYNHGSNALPGVGWLMAGFFSRRGYVFFFPHRRGHGMSPGRYIMDLAHDAPVDDKTQVLVDELVAQSDDVLAAIDFLAQQPFVDKSRMVLAGCSFGGIETLLAAERTTAVRAAVDFAGAAESWNANPPLRDRLRLAVDRARVPIFFIQAANDFSTLPTSELAAEAAAHGKAHRAKIYPPFGTTHKSGHSFCGAGRDIWAADVDAFLKEALK